MDTKYYKATTHNKRSKYNYNFPGFQEGEIYEEEEAILCRRGFHFTKDPLVVLEYYKWPNFLLWEVEPLGIIIGDPKDKLVTNKLKMVRILPWEETKGLLTGTLMGYYESGGLYWERSYKDGYMDGVSKEYHSQNGALSCETTYKDGKEHGLHKEYYSDGKPSFEGNWKEGKEDGDHTSYCHEGSTILYTDTYDNGVFLFTKS